MEGQTKQSYRKTAIVIGAATAFVFAGSVMFGGRGKIEGPMAAPSASVKIVEKKIERKPKSDCDPSFGFRNPASPSYKEKCGYAGDGKVQEKYETTSDKPVPGKTAIDYDFACANAKKTGELDNNVYATPEVMKDRKPAAVVYVVKTLDESCYPIKEVKKEKKVVAPMKAEKKEAPEAEKPSQVEEKKDPVPKKTKRYDCAKQAMDLARSGPPPDWADPQCNRHFGKSCRSLTLDERYRYFHRGLFCDTALP